MAGPRRKGLALVTSLREPRLSSREIVQLTLEFFENLVGLGFLLNWCLRLSRGGFTGSFDGAKDLVDVFTDFLNRRFGAARTHLSFVRDLLSF